MAMIQGIDGSALLAAFRQGRSDRSTDDKAKAAAEETKLRKGLMGQLFGGSPPSAGVAGNYAPAQPQPPPVAPGATFSEAFSPDAMGAIQNAPAAIAPSAPPPQQGPRRPDPNVLAQLIVLDPETGGKIATAFKAMDETQLKQIEARNSHMGAAARYVQQGKTPEERMQRFQIAVPSLLEAGYTPQELDGIDNDLSDQRLQYYQATAIDYDKMIDNELAEREFSMGKQVPVTAGGSVASIRPQMDASGNVIGTTQEYIIGGPGGQAGAAPVQVQSIEQARQLPPGTRFIDPNGVERVVPGGGAGNGVGGFP